VYYRRVTYREVGSPARGFRILSRRTAVEFQLTEDQITTKKWAHEFAENEIRPVAPHHDETEEFPWPVLKKAAEIGLYGMEFYTEMVGGDPSGITLPMVMEELTWGCAGI